MKIGIACYPTLGGSGIVATELGHELARRGHEVHFITYEIPFRLEMAGPNIHFHEVAINHYDLFKYPDYALTLAVKMANVARAENLDILHVHYAIPHATSAYLAKQIMGAGAPKIITTLHGTDITLVGSDPAFHQVVKFSIEASDVVTAVSHKLKEQTQTLFKTDKEIEVIHNFFTPKAELVGKKPLRNQFVQGEEKLICHASNYRMVKRPLDVLHIFEKIHRQIPSKLLLVGSGPGLEEIRRLVPEWGLEGSVFFVGENRNIDPYFASSDLFLLPSAQESFGLAALEAMAYGVPVIASDVGGLPELVSNGESGFLCPLGDSEMMAKRAIELFRDQNLYDEMSAAAARRAKEHFSIEKIIPIYERLYLSP